MICFKRKPKRLEKHTHTQFSKKKKKKKKNFSTKILKSDPKRHRSKRAGCQESLKRLCLKLAPRKKIGAWIVGVFLIFFLLADDGAQKLTDVRSAGQHLSN
jgi:hypothetical protein